MLKFWRLMALAAVLVGSALTLAECSSGNHSGSSTGGVTGTTPGTGY